MITKLNEEQKQKLAEYKNKYINIGLDTQPIDAEKLQKQMNLFYEHILHRKPVKTIICDNPVQAYYMCFFYKIMKNKIKKIPYQIQNVENEVVNEVENEVKNEVCKKLENEVSKKLENEVSKNVKNEVVNEVVNEVWNELENEVCKKVKNEVSKKLENDVCDEVVNEIRNKVIEKVVNEVGYKVRSEVCKEVRNEVDNEVENEIGNEVRNEVMNEVWNEVNKKVKDYKYPYLYGQFDAGYYSFYSYMKEVLQIDLGYKYDIYESLKDFNFLYCLKDICFASQKPIEINKDDQGRLHADDRPALLYKGLALWRINGMRVPKYIVTNPELITIEKIQKEANQEVKRIMIERFGVSEYLTQIDSKVIDMDCRDNEGAAPRVLIEDCNKNRWFVVTDGSTRRVYHLFVDKNINTCKQAHESLCGFDENLILIES